MKINENQKSLKTAALILLIFNIYQLIAIDFYALLLMLLKICSILHFSWSILVKCCVHLRTSNASSREDDMPQI